MRLCESRRRGASGAGVRPPGVLLLLLLVLLVLLLQVLGLSKRHLVTRHRAPPLRVPGRAALPAPRGHGVTFTVVLLWRARRRLAVGARSHQRRGLRLARVHHGMRRRGHGLGPARGRGGAEDVGEGGISLLAAGLGIAARALGSCSSIVLVVVGHGGSVAKPQGPPAVKGSKGGAGWRGDGNAAQRSSAGSSSSSGGGGRSSSRSSRVRPGVTVGRSLPKGSSARTLGEGRGAEQGGRNVQP